MWTTVVAGADVLVVAVVVGVACLSFGYWDIFEHNKIARLVVEDSGSLAHQLKIVGPTP